MLSTIATKSSLKHDWDYERKPEPFWQQNLSPSPTDSIFIFRYLFIKNSPLIIYSASDLNFMILIQYKTVVIKKNLRFFIFISIFLWCFKKLGNHFSFSRKSFFLSLCSVLGERDETTERTCGGCTCACVAGESLRSWDVHHFSVCESAVVLIGN